MRQLMARKLFDRDASTLRTVVRKLPLLAVMVCIFSFTSFAVLNTAEIVGTRDLPLSNVLTAIRITEDDSLDQKYREVRVAQLDPGRFGVPILIRLPEMSRYIPVNSAMVNDRWTARKGEAHVVVTDNPREMVFGQALLYMRTNTIMTQNTGEILPGDSIAIATDEGWELTYEVRETADDPSKLAQDASGNVSELVLSFVDESTGHIQSVRATLTQVGDRL